LQQAGWRTRLGPRQPLPVVGKRETALDGNITVPKIAI